MLDRMASQLKRIAGPFLVHAASRRRARLSGTQFVGITGSCGKTTTKELLADCLSRQAPCSRNHESENSTWSLARTILRTHRHHRFAVLEIGIRKPGQMRPRAELLRPHVAMVTCIAAAHTEGMKSLTEIAEEKSELLRALTQGGTAILLKDDSSFDFLRSTVPGHAQLVTVSMKTDADFVGVITDSARGMFDIIETASGCRQPLALSIPGRAQMINSLLAAAAARTLGLGWPDIEHALQTFSGLPLRWQKSECHGLTIINDAYNANPAAMRMALETFEAIPVRGRKWLVLGGMRELGESEHAEHLALGRTVAQGPWGGLVTVGPWAEVMARAACEAGFPAEQVETCSDAASAASVLRRRVAAGDAVLLKASRFYKLEKVEEAWRRQTH